MAKTVRLASGLRLLRRPPWAMGVAVAVFTVAMSVTALAAYAITTPAPHTAIRTAVPRTQARPADSSASVSATSTAADAPARVPPSSASVGVLAPAGDVLAHGCTGTVVASATGEVIVTAAHCVSGSGDGLIFAPGYQAGNAPYGTWVVQSAYVAVGWLNSQDPTADVAFLTVLPASSNASAASVQAVVGGYPVANAPSAGDQVQVSGYVTGEDAATACTATVYLTGGYPSFDCAGFAGGTSGGPWISTGPHETVTLTGVIGGLHQGGCTPDTSYSAAFTANAATLLARAEGGRAPDILPSSGSDGC
jgi:V8-like Glu-specific endopeptidase